VVEVQHVRRKMKKNTHCSQQNLLQFTNLLTCIMSKLESSQVNQSINQSKDF